MAIRKPSARSRPGHRRPVPAPKTRPVRGPKSPGTLGPKSAAANPAAEIKRLRTENEQYRVISAAVREAIIIMDGAKRITFWNDAAERIFGYTSKEALGLDPHDFIAPPEYRPNFDQTFPHWLETGRGEAMGKTFELNALRKNGERFPIEISLSTAMRGDIRLAIAIIRDVSRRHKAEEDLKYQNILMATQQEVSPDGILVVDSEGRVRSFNKRYLEMWSIPSKVAALESAEEILRATRDQMTDPAKFEARIRSVLENRRRESHDIIELRDGRTFERFSASVYGPDDTYYGRVWNYRDISVRVRAEREVRSANEKLSAMVKKLEEKDLRNMALEELRDFLLASPAMGEIGPIIGRSMKRLFPDSEGALFLLSPSRTDLEAAARWGDFPEDLEDNVFSPDLCWSLRKGFPYILDDPGSGLICPHLKHKPSGGYACLPLMAKGDVLGLLHIRKQAGGGPEDDARMIAGLKDVSSSLAQVLSLSLSNIILREKLSSQSIRDPLTGLFNRRYMEENFQREIFRAARKKDQIGVLMIDIDHFKMFNDLNGHPAGDAALAEVGGFLKSQIRGGDIACRYGGEEFTLILPECPQDIALQRAQLLVGEVQNLRIQYSGRGIGPISLSIGVAVYPAHGSNPEDLLRAADAALYRAKQEGRNRAVLA